MAQGPTRTSPLTDPTYLFDKKKTTERVKLIFFLTQGGQRDAVVTFSSSLSIGRASVPSKLEIDIAATSQSLPAKK
jgi:hypothetical protein